MSLRQSQVYRPQALIVNADKIAKADSVARKALHLEENKPPVVVNLALLSAPAARAIAIEASEIAVPELPGAQLADEDQPVQLPTNAG